MPSLPFSPSQAWRIMHGVAEGLPGITVDKYGETLLVQSWRAPLVGVRSHPRHPPFTLLH